MSSEIAKQLLEVSRELGEHAKYLAELGAETIDVMPADVPVAHHPASSDIQLSEMKRTPIPAPAAQAPRAAEPTPVRTSEVAASRRQEALFGELPSAPRTEYSPATLAETLEDIWNDIGDCTRCGLCEGRTQVVNTHGNRKARLMFVGEAPGADEDAQGKPFVGRAGQLLTKIIEAIGMKREDVMIGNVNRCRPPGNRQPTLEEAAICRPFLFREIAAVKPEVIVVMGNTALQNLLEIRKGISSVRGEFREFRGIKVMPTFHPAYLLRDPSKKRETWEDLKKVRDYLDSLPPRSD